MSNLKIKVGSCAFFCGLEGFNPGDEDWVILESPESKRPYKYNSQLRLKNKCIFFWIERPKEEMINYLLNSKDPLQVGKFLVPEFSRRLGITIEDLHRLNSMVDALDKNHKYYKIIYDSYLLNGEFILTEEQLAKAFKVYKEARSS